MTIREILDARDLRWPEKCHHKMVTAAATGTCRLRDPIGVTTTGQCGSVSSRLLTKLGTQHLQNK